MISQKKIQGLGVTLKDDNIYLYYNSFSDDGTTFCLDTSANGLHFIRNKNNPQIIDRIKKIEDTGACRDFRISRFPGEYVLTYMRKQGNASFLCRAVSKDLITFNKIGKIEPVKETGMIVPRFTFQGKYCLYFGEKTLKLAYSGDLRNWKVNKDSVLPSPNPNSLVSVKIAGLQATPEGIVAFYFAETVENGFTHYSLHCAVFDPKNPAKFIYRSPDPIWTEPTLWLNKKVYPVGLVLSDKSPVSYWEVENEGFYAISHSSFSLNNKVEDNFPHFFLKRFSKNPILKPIAEHYWESKATFNPGALYENGKVHLVYRAIGDNDMSVLGYASSSDGLTIDKRLKQPIYFPRKPFECSGTISPGFIPYMSGGGWGGCEDPRLTRIGDRIYMTYVAFDGWSPPRSALTSISSSDFFNHNWNWNTPVLISKPGVVDKNTVLFPEKVNGKYVIFHRIYPDILVDFVDSLDFDGTRFLKGEYSISPCPTSWDSRKIGAGPPPIKTDAGWLLIYHSVGEQDSSRYKMGAMLLDLKDPTRVLYRSRQPILEPVATYENEGFKSGVAYPCGSVVIKDRLLVYYGGADQVVCTAQANLNNFLNGLRTNQVPQFEPLTIASGLN